MSNRLKAMVDLLPPTDTLADIGTDHGMLLMTLLTEGKIKKGIGVEIREGPLGRARNNITASGYSDRIEIRMGDGLAPVAEGEVTAIAIAGMGGGTIKGILEANPAKARSARWLLLQPMNAESQLRHFLRKSAWRIDKEAIALDGGKIYQIILAAQGHMEELSPAEAAFGPKLLEGRSPLTILAIKKDIEKLENAIRGLDKSSAPESRRKREILAGRKKAWEALL